MDDHLSLKHITDIVRAADDLIPNFSELSQGHICDLVKDTKDWEHYKMIRLFLSIKRLQLAEL